MSSNIYCLWCIRIISNTVPKTSLRLSLKLAQYLIGTKKKLDFASPYYQIERQDSEEIRKQILRISYTDWKKLGFSKGTLHYMKQNAGGNKPFTLNKHVRDRIGKWDKLTAYL